MVAPSLWRPALTFIMQRSAVSRDVDVDLHHEESAHTSSHTTNHIAITNLHTSVTLDRFSYISTQHYDVECCRFEAEEPTTPLHHRHN